MYNDFFYGIMDQVITKDFFEMIKSKKKIKLNFTQFFNQFVQSNTHAPLYTKLDNIESIISSLSLPIRKTKK